MQKSLVLFLSFVLFTLPSVRLFAAVDHAVETEVLKNLHIGNQEEVAVGKLAQQQASVQPIKDFATMIVNDHTQADQKVVDLAKRASVTLEDSNSTEAIDALKPLRGPDFDKEFLAMMVDDHQDMIDSLKAALPKLDDGDTAKLVNELLPVLQAHLDQAKKLQ